MNERRKSVRQALARNAVVVGIEAVRVARPLGLKEVLGLLLRVEIGAVGRVCRTAGARVVIGLATVTAGYEETQQKRQCSVAHGLDGSG